MNKYLAYSIDIPKRLHSSYRQAQADKAAAIREAQRLERLDLSGMTLPDLLAEHHAVTIRLENNYHRPEGEQELEERLYNLEYNIKKMKRRTK